MNEHEIQNAIRQALQFLPGEFWRINVGAGYMYHGFQKKPQWFSTGVPKGFPDLIGIIPHKITESDIGKIMGQFCFVEVKSEKGKTTNDQRLFHHFLLENGACGGVARSVEEAVDLFRKK